MRQIIRHGISMTDEKFGHDTFLSPFTWRYASPEMRRVFSEINYRGIWRRIWVYLAEAEAEYGLVSSEELADLKSKMGTKYVDLRRSKEWEERIRHDVMAEIKTYAEQCPKGGGKIHLGATSADIIDNADVLRMKEALDLILTRLVRCLDSTSKKIEKFKDLTCMGWTHLQPAEPTTLGYRLANYAQDIYLDIIQVEYLLQVFVKGKGIKGAVGTSASYKRMLDGRVSTAILEEKVMSKIGLKPFLVATQTYPRKLDYIMLSALASTAQSLHKFAFDLRFAQSPIFGEMAEPIKGEQVGSTAMPFKRNPTSAERICSLSRYIGTLPSIAFFNAANTLMERTLDDSANRRIIIPEAFLALDECLILYEKIMDGIKIYPYMVKKNLEMFGSFTGTEPLLIRLVEKGLDRQKMHELIREYSFKAWERVMRGEANPLPGMLKNEPLISSKIEPNEVDMLLNPQNHTGDASERCDAFVKKIVAPVIRQYSSRLEHNTDKHT